MNLRYLDTNRKNIDVERQRQQILRYTAENNLTDDTFVQENILFLRAHPELKGAGNA